MDKKQSQGRPKGVPIEEKIINAMGVLLNSKSNIDGNASYVDVDFQRLVNIITEMLRKHLNENPNDHSILNKLKSKLTSPEIEDFKTGGLRKEILNLKTLKRCYVDKVTSQKTLDILKAFYITYEKNTQRKAIFKRELARVSGLYYEFVTHNSAPGKFQESIMYITKEGYARNRYKNTDYEIIERRLEAELIGTTGLLLTFKDNDDLLVFYIYIGGNDQPPFLQGVYMYSNRQGNTVANLAVFKRIELGEGETLEDKFYYFEPTRELDNLSEKKITELQSGLEKMPNISIRQNIQHFLFQRAKTITTLLYQNRPFDFSLAPALFPGPYSKPALFYNSQKKFVGEYFLYFNEGYPSVKRISKVSTRNEFFSSVGRGILTIELSDKTGILECGLRLKRNESTEDELVYRGRIINDYLRNSSYLILTLYLKPENDRYLNIVFNIIDQNKLIGGFNTTYTPPGKIGSGIVVANRMGKKLEDEKEKVKATAIDVRRDKLDNKFEKRIVNFLSRNRKSLVTSSDYRMFDEAYDALYQGNYRIYSKRKRGDDQLQISILKIYANGEVEHFDAQKNIAFGEAEHQVNNLTIKLRNSENTQQGFFCIRVDNVSPSKKERALYAGTFAGFSKMGNQNPVSSQFIMEYVNDTIEESVFKGETFNWEEFGNIEIPEEVINHFKNEQTILKFDKTIF